MICRPLRNVLQHMRYGFVLLLLLLLGACSSGTTWQLNSAVKGHLPDLRFALTNDHGQAVTEADYTDKITLLFFGYTHCPDVCPLTLARLHQVMEMLGDDARHVQILFVSVDPARDTPQAMHRYVNAFDERAVGLVGSPRTTRRMAKRYRVAYHRDEADSHGNYTVSHASGVYVFDRQQRIRLLATFTDTPASIHHDLQQLITQEFHESSSRAG